MRHRSSRAVMVPLKGDARTREVRDPPCLGSQTSLPSEIDTKPSSLPKWKTWLATFGEFHGLIGMLAWWVAFGSGLFVKSDVDVTHSVTTLFEVTGTRAESSADVIPELLEIQVTNNLRTRVTEVAMRVNGVESLSRVGAGASFSRLQNHEIAAFSVKNGAANFPEFTEIPPRTTIVLQLWGKFSSPFPSPRVQLSAAVERISVSSIYQTRGIRLFVAENLHWLAMLLTVYFLLVGLRIRTNKVSK